jgi:bifunctional DNA-binding transcriptional regulator/antitoxin component of YhaV-PrlF toxin-antitoxin module
MGGQIGKAWDNPTLMKLIVDQKRRVVLPKSVKPGDALEVISTGDVIVLHLLKPVLKGVPPVSPNPVSRDLFAGVDLDEPGFDTLSNESVA